MKRSRCAQTKQQQKTLAGKCNVALSMALWVKHRTQKMCKSWCYKTVRAKTYGAMLQRVKMQCDVSANAKQNKEHDACTPSYRHADVPHTREVVGRVVADPRCCVDVHVQLRVFLQNKRRPRKKRQSVRGLYIGVSWLEIQEQFDYGTNSNNEHNDKTRNTNLRAEHNCEHEANKNNKDNNRNRTRHLHQW